jgi:ferrochelatase
MSDNIGVILLNLGSPESPSVPHVRKYLQQFLMDPCVLDINPIGRALLVYGPISIFRAPKSAHAYESVWMKQQDAANGSPLVHYSLSAAKKLLPELDSKFKLAVAMRYQNPSIENALRSIEIEKCSELRVLPLYPQFALSTSVTGEIAVRSALRKFQFNGKLNFLKPFYAHPKYIAAQAARGRKLWLSGNYDFVLFSFHGIPERQISRFSNAASDCLKKTSCCDLSNDNDFDYCYRKQCFKNAKLVADSLGLREDQWSVSFQSRLGRTPWIKPYTDFVLPELVSSGKKRLLVYSPSFVADCLETLEEIAIRERAGFIEKGGTELTLVPSLNDSPEWISALKEFVNSSELFCEGFRS